MSRIQKRLAIALAISVALNLFAAGAFLSRHFFGPPPPGWHGKKEAARILSEPQRELVDEIWERDRELRRKNFRAMRESRQRFRDIVTAETFDPAAARAELGKLDGLMETTGDSIEERILEIAETLPAEQRRAYFTAFFADEIRRDKEWERRAKERHDDADD